MPSGAAGANTRHQTATVEVTVTDASRRNIDASSVVPVGLKALNLAAKTNRNLVTPGDNARVELKSMNLADKPVAISGTLYVEKLVWNETAKKDDITTVSTQAASIGGDGSPEQFRDSFESRLIALSRAHDLLTRSHWESAQLRNVLLHELKPYIADDLSRVSIEGQDVALPPRMALTLALAFHELTTNAAKYGALSTDTGRVSVRWEVFPAGKVAPQRLSLDWVESGGPAVSNPQRRGFGSQLLERSLRYELRGDTRLQFTSTGVRCHVEVPLQSEQN